MKRGLIALLLFVTMATAMEAKHEIRWISTCLDLGVIREADGKASGNLQFVNVGDSALRIQAVRATCGCTATEYTHGYIAPGDTATVTITYNPEHRPGDFEKDVYVYITDLPASERRQVVTLQGRVIAAESTLADRYPIAVGPLHLTFDTVLMGQMVRRGKFLKYVSGYNASSDTLLISAQNVPEHIAIETLPDSVPPGSSFAVTVSYNAYRAPHWGFGEEGFTLIAHQLHSGLPTAAFSHKMHVTSIITEDFDRLTPEQREAAPVARLDKETIDLVKVSPTNGVIQRRIYLTNDGKSNLQVRRIYSQNANISATARVSTVKPKKSAEILVNIDVTEIRNNMINETLDIITNDPEHSVLHVRIVGEVEN